LAEQPAPAPLEASGTSGQKVVLNGGLNCSILDGWWAEAFDGSNGFAIGTGRVHVDQNIQDDRDAKSLYGRADARGDPAVLRARRRRPAAKVDLADETSGAHAGLAIQRRTAW